MAIQQILLFISLFIPTGTAFSPSSGKFITTPSHLSQASLAKLSVQTDDDSYKESGGGLTKTFGGYTVKQRLREEVESPFRKVRLVFFGSSTGSALTALYFSATNALKAYLGGYSDAPPLEDSLISCGINIGAAVVCGFLTYRDYKIGEANLERIARGSALAKLGIVRDEEGKFQGKFLGDYRRKSRVLVCAGGEEYIQEICKSLNSDQLEGKNTIPQKLVYVDVVVVPVLLQSESGDAADFSVGDTKTCWEGTEPTERDRNFNINRSNSVIGFPRGNAAWSKYLESDVKTAIGQGFDVLNKGITITVKKNGKILRRATGLPRWRDLISAMEYLRDSQFGMPGDSEKYGGP